MQQYTSRRRRCWKLLKELDPDIELSEGHRADMLLDLAGLGQNERIMIQASIGNQRDFDKIADALVVQHPRIHVREQRHQVHRGKGKGKGLHRASYGHKKSSSSWLSYKGKAHGKGKTFNRAYGTANIADDYDYDESAYVANDWDAEPWEEVDNDPAYHSEEEAYLGDDGQEEEETEDAVEAEELNCMAHLADTFGDGVWDEKNAAEASEYVQSSTVAFVAFGKKGKGKSKGKKGKGSYPIRPSNLSIQDRRNKLQELKNRTECKECGRRGHWAGDAACTMTKAGQSKQRIGAVACHETVGSAPEPQEDACVCCLSDASDTEKTTLMAYKQKPVPITPSNRLRFPKAVAYQPIGKAPPPQWQEEWHMTDYDEEPVTTEGQDHAIFTVGTFKGCRFVDVLNQHPQQYLTARNSKVLPREMQAFVDWVGKFYSVNPKTKKVTLVAELAPRTVQGQVHTGPSTCPCTNVHHSGSSAKYHRTTCRDCGSVTQVL